MREYSRVYARIDLDRIIRNMEAMEANIQDGTSMIGVVKADGYGHGAVPVARVIDSYVAAYAVATVEEGIILRRHGIGKPILVLGVTHESQFEDLIHHEIRPTIFRYEKARILSELAVSLGARAKIHLALDTGMSRIGMEPDEKAADMAAEISRLPGVEIEGMFTHFARADEKDKSAAIQQLARYQHFAELLEARGIRIPIRHCSNSAGIIDLPGANLDMVRAGISIYGLYPSDEVERDVVKLSPAMELKSRITYVKTIEPDTAVSYGGTYVAGHRTRVATIPVGYGDGYPRNLSNAGSVLIRGRRARILGRVCMDQFMVDVTSIPEAAEDDEVTLIGSDGDERITMEELAEISGGYHYELACNIGKRIPRVYVQGGRTVGSKDYFDDVYKDFL